VIHKHSRGYPWGGKELPTHSMVLSLSTCALLAKIEAKTFTYAMVFATNNDKNKDNGLFSCNFPIHSQKVAASALEENAEKSAFSCSGCALRRLLHQCASAQERQLPQDRRHAEFRHQEGEYFRSKRGISKASISQFMGIWFEQVHTRRWSGDLKCSVEYFSLAGPNSFYINSFTYSPS
jgi:hypothetical protein